MIHRNHLFLFLFFCCAIISCKKDDVGDKIDLEISILELPVEGNVRLEFWCSGGTFKCNNVALAYSLHQTENAIFVDFGRSYIPDGKDCIELTGYNTASARAYFTIDLPDGDYLLEFSNRDRLLKSGIRIDSESIQVVGKSSVDEIKLKLHNGKLWRIPDDAVWGYVEGTESKLNAILNSLYALGAEDYGPLLHDGSYTYFSVENGNAASPNFSAYPQFVIKSPLDTATLMNTLRSFPENTVLYDGKGNRLESH